MRAVINRDDARLMDHLVADDDVPGTLRDVVGVAVNHRRLLTGTAERDAAVVQAPIGVRVGRPAALPGSLARASSLPCCRSDRWNLPTRRIEHQPRLGIVGGQVLVPMRRGCAGIFFRAPTDAAGTRLRALLPLRAQRRHLLLAELLEALAREIRRPLHLPGGA